MFTVYLKTKVKLHPAMEPFIERIPYLSPVWKHSDGEVIVLHNVVSMTWNEVSKTWEIFFLLHGAWEYVRGTIAHDDVMRVEMKEGA
jgi:hypothetical protein